MSLPCFTTLCNMLQTNYGLQPTLNISIEESVAMFLRICGHNEVQRDVGLRFGRNQETVQRKFREVLTATELLACDYIRTPTRQELYRIPERLQVDRRYWPYFSGFVEAMDGTHKYYLVDSGYPNKQEFLAPYRSSRNRVVRYHMSQFYSGPPPRNKHELFNQCHASLRSVIERTFGVWKKKWRIISDFPRYNVHIQKRVVMATVGLHNFIRISNFSDADFADVMTETNINNGDFEHDVCDMDATELADGEYMTQIRDNIANMLWGNQNNR
ncbi:unnamed protein product [Arabidopsis lyrata]|uniref:Uncharacterized protein n=1 Tax=Arabidopsis lyrata subsp. lyrata TaxID=81972 RepID=D7LPC6_ARALL|nr:hypothetical protein ARALYDRAFT_323065 [Arabidopsis lyrata subsp. lyrata]CAH8267255.1 unnamed protein product [Arabidopsis lyrata]